MLNINQLIYLKFGLGVCISGRRWAGRPYLALDRPLSLFFFKFSHLVIKYGILKSGDIFGGFARG